MNTFLRNRRRRIHARAGRRFIGKLFCIHIRSFNIVDSSKFKYLGKSSFPLAPINSPSTIIQICTNTRTHTYTHRVTSINKRSRSPLISTILQTIIRLDISSAVAAAAAAATKTKRGFHRRKNARGYTRVMQRLPPPPLHNQIKQIQRTEREVRHIIRVHVCSFYQKRKARGEKAGGSASEAWKVK